MSKPINVQMRKFFAAHKPARDRLTCSCGWEALDGMWVDHLAEEMSENSRGEAR